ncbi:HPr-rel-A system PqqD family peptide chaperone [Sphingomonas sp.]|uniref:HPr-rel-A system PqqD family peptide chaperone n=1 Tax=Sphingomonas sp. TaxID=28214 RepID=UPI001DCCB652|nr:HPr-rel-A system PqqD family peptide chaperone [Sphingomonas sp.]MBX9795807.1 HPr-rel-A system PqqD family peptide chaperone [Sphingomonas sp.]
MAAVFAPPAPGRLRIVPLDDLTLVYDRASGITHVLASPAPEILAALDTPMSADALLQRLAGDFALADDAAPALAARLDELALAGLVERR